MRTWPLPNSVFMHLEIVPKDTNLIFEDPSLCPLWWSSSNWLWPKQVFHSLYLSSGSTLTKRQVLSSFMCEQDQLTDFPLSHPSISCAIFSVESKKGITEISTLLKTLNHLHEIPHFHASVLPLNLTSNCPKLLWYQSTAIDYIC